MFDISLTATDDDGGVDSDGATVIIAGNSGRARSLGYWQTSYRGRTGFFDSPTLDCYLAIAGFMSAVFNEVVDASTQAKAAQVLHPRGQNTMSDLLDAQLPALSPISRELAMRQMMLMTLLPLLLVGAATCTAHPMSETGIRCEDHPLHPRLLAAANHTLRVIVTLGDDRDDDVQRLQDRLVALVEGTEHQVLRRYDNFPIVALSVGEEAFCRLVASTLVKAIQEDVPEPPGP